jgi:cell division protein FtsL
MNTLLRLLIATSLVLAIAKHYLHDTKQQTETKPAKPKKQIEQFQQQLNDINVQADEKRRETLEDLGL